MGLFVTHEILAWFILGVIFCWAALLANSFVLELNSPELTVN